MVCRKSLYRKIVFSVDYVKIIELHVLHTKVNGKLSIWNNEGNNIYKKGQ